MVLGLGSWEITFVGLALLVLFGPEHAPNALRKAGEMQAQVQQAFKQLEQAVEEEEEKAKEMTDLSKDEADAGGDRDESS